MPASSWSVIVVAMISTSAALTPPVTRSRPAWRYIYTVLLAGLGWYSTAIAWQAQLVSYPLFRSVGPAEFPAYHLDYNDSILLVVVVPGFVTFLAGAAFWWARPHGVGRRRAAVVSLASLVSLLATVLWAIPQHDELDRSGQSSATIDSLLAANLVRSFALTVVAVDADLGRRQHRHGPDVQSGHPPELTVAHPRGGAPCDAQCWTRGV